MKGQGFTFMMAVLSLATGCCSTSERWGYMEGYDNIPSSLTVAPQQGEYSLWRLAGIDNDGLCACRDGPDLLVTIVTLNRGDRLDIRKRGERMEAYAGSRTLTLPTWSYAWRRKMTADELNIKARDDILQGVLLTLVFVMGMLGGTSY